MLTVTSSTLIETVTRSDDRWPTPARNAQHFPRLSRGNLLADVVVVLLDRREQAVERRLAAERAPGGVDMRLELVAELVDVAGDRHRGRVAERAEALAEDAVADVEQQVELALLCAPVLDLVQELHHPARPLAARRALAARLVHVELRDAEPELNHAGPVVDHDHGARAEHRPLL